MESGATLSELRDATGQQRSFLRRLHPTLPNLAEEPGHHRRGVKTWTKWNANTSKPDSKASKPPARSSKDDSPTKNKQACSASLRRCNNAIQTLDTLVCSLPWRSLRKRPSIHKTPQRTRSPSRPPRNPPRKTAFQRLRSLDCVSGANRFSFFAYEKTPWRTFFKNSTRYGGSATVAV